MLESKKRWKIEEMSSNSDWEAGSVSISPFIKELLCKRGITSAETAEKFLHPTVEHLHNPDRLHDIDIAAARIHKAIANQEKILVFGDYDADGVSSTAVMLEALHELGAVCDFYIPNRFREGYGPNEEAFRLAKENGTDLIITVDTGIAAHHEAFVAKELGIDLIITDHHEVQEKLPEALAVVHPKCSPDYPFHELAGVGVAFKLAQKLLGYFPAQLLDLVVIGTIADLVPLLDENRIFAKEGLRAISTTSRPGLQALKKICGISGNMQADDIGFKIGPRINAVGRLQDADLAVELLMTDDLQTAEQLAEEVDALNQERQAIVAKISKEAEAMVAADESQTNTHVIVVAKEGWNEGVLGIVASKLVRTFDRPAIVLAINHDKGTAKGSARSIDSFDLFANCMQIRDQFEAFGGHAQAAGMTIALDNVAKVRNALNDQAASSLSPEDFKQSLQIDLQLSPSDVSLEFIQELEQLAPFGMANPKPLVKLHTNVKEMRLIGSNKNHLKFTFTDGQTLLDGICFGQGDLYPFLVLDDQLEAVGELAVNEWNGRQKPQLLVEDVRVANWQLFDYRGNKNTANVAIKVPEETAAVRFRPETELSWIPESIRLLDYDTEGLTNASNHINSLIFTDMPKNLSDLQAVLKHMKPDLIYACYGVKDSAYLQGFPDREHFKYFYAMLLKHKQMPLEQFERHLKAAKGWNSQRIRFISEVFFELDFVKIEEAHIKINPNPSKRDLTDSVVYQNLKKTMEAEKILYYSSYKELKQWMTIALERGEVTEEEAVNGL